MNKRPQPFNRRHTASRILRYVFAGYKFRFFLVLLCILVSAIASIIASFSSREREQTVLRVE